LAISFLLLLGVRVTACLATRLPTAAPTTGETVHSGALASRQHHRPYTNRENCSAREHHRHRNPEDPITYRDRLAWDVRPTSGIAANEVDER